MGERGERHYQITVFGATGYTGRFVVEELKKRQTKGVSWAVAGRNEEKLKTTLRGTHIELSMHVGMFTFQ